ncbi:hypothetical protein PCASD_06336 [Puccinia coronata f. sp. avenae]|uniref:Uncharacterized protein n=1 Tax=Puccinia coronata f. sp. avenae TaxID=200324 RepID=A0A2N5V939_9BASI|nr:hypothetical protein PCASD_15802 [Puccinia coronata f. sp. avenae]PLW46519.1 hypothetical protein PCASD_06336 [Puccinia coronata f. sp. avenae]
MSRATESRGRGPYHEREYWIWAEQEAVVGAGLFKVVWLPIQQKVSLEPLPKRGSSPQDFELDGVDQPTTASEGAYLAILRNQLEMVENEDGSEGGSSGLFAAGTSNPDPADTSVGGV